MPINCLKSASLRGKAEWKVWKSKSNDQHKININNIIHLSAFNDALIRQDLTLKAGFYVRVRFKHLMSHEIHESISVWSRRHCWHPFPVKTTFRVIFCRFHITKSVHNYSYSVKMSIIPIKYRYSNLQFFSFYFETGLESSLSKIIPTSNE